MRCARRDGAQDGDTVGLEVERADERRGDDQPDQRGRDAAVAAGADEHDDQHPDADGQRPSVHRVQVCQHVDEVVLVRARRGRQAEELRELVGDDDHGHAGQEAGDDRGREELGDPPQAQDAHQHHDEADHHRQDPYQVDITGRAGQREGAHPGREQRSNRRIGPHGHLRIRSEQGEEHRPGDEGVEAGDRWHARQPGGRELLGHGDDEQRQARHQVRPGPGTPVSLQRGEERRASHRDIIAHRPLRQIDPIE